MIPHVFQADPDLPADHRGRRVCSVCHLVGRAGDAHHDVPPVPEQAEHLRRIGDDSLESTA
jgi:hypothetical protein